MSRLSRFGDDVLFEQARKALEDPSSVKPVEGPTLLDDGTIEFTGINADVTRYTVIKKDVASAPADKVSSEPPAVIEFESTVDTSKLSVVKNRVFSK